mmetsp:Transcript_8702/g.11531  ORF Transcript_8702/g.11531 Transcript_8702/m.11531 type:complete len:228 (+) Transcript_8702:160-843(+)|eukprot:CAMPEP_0198144392 /NCGR_PEP_ID=MMETSP1443-20131203/15376_1 /TAXON_ID=186043 /ORGANISM="Entomoneis sp., Strain CCMP2396" /LENGTH=227 /DNA_ID=CAMNT_0043807779 /DNA_START=44 /DNA_END=727 /DNA_ORIENTATION=+
MAEQVRVESDSDEDDIDVPEVAFGRVSDSLASPRFKNRKAVGSAPMRLRESFGSEASSVCSDSETLIFDSQDFTLTDDDDSNSDPDPDTGTGTSTGRKRVQFGDVRERTFRMTLVEHPCADGVPVGLAWDYDKKSLEYSLDEHEQKPKKELCRISKASRRRIALRNHSTASILDTLDNMKQIKSFRIESGRENIKAAMIEEGKRMRRGAVASQMCEGSQGLGERTEI